MDECRAEGRGPDRGRSNRRGPRYGAAPAFLLALGMLAPVVDAQESHGHAGRPEDRAGIFTTIEVTSDHPAADVACIFCTVRVEGDVRGDLAVMFGTVQVGEGQTISGDVATLFSSLSLADGARINGDLATAFGAARIAPGASVRGDRAIFSSGLGVALVLGPLLILIGAIWLIAWGLRRALSYR